MTKPVELEDLLDEFAEGLTEEDMHELEKYFGQEAIVHYLKHSLSYRGPHAKKEASTP
jgi:hypothetical protein